MPNNSTSTSSLDSLEVAQRVADEVTSYRQMRIRWERTWYDNDFFDDGFHFRYVSRNTGRIIDKTNASNAPTKMRAIPKASKQIRGIANLLVGTNPHPVIYPEQMLASNFPTPEAFAEAKKEAIEIAKKRGNWLNKEWDQEEVYDKAVEMIILAAKQSVAYLKVMPDPVNGGIKCVTRDGFDVFLLPTIKDIDQSPVVAESVAVPIQEIWNNELYDERVRLSVSPDNKFSGSAIKDAYLRTRFGLALQGVSTGTAIKNEAFIREYLNEENTARIKKQKDADIVLRGKKKGDPVTRQVVTTLDGKPLYDHYTTLSIYPYAPFRFEPGYMYQVSQIERFIPANKSLDAVVSRIEGFLHTMVTGIWAKRKTEGFRITNQYGGQVVEYDNDPPINIPSANVPPFVFQFIGLLNSFIEEQGLSVNTLAQIPTGVKAFRAIESLKESELNNLQIPLKQFQKTMKRVAQLYLEYADDFMVSPKMISGEDSSDPESYQVIGQRAFDLRNELKVPNDGLVPINKKAPIKIEIENGAAFTEEGRKSQMLELIQTLMPLFQTGSLPPEFLKLLATELMDTFKVGSLQEMTQALENLQAVGDVSQDDIEKIKIAMLEVMKDVTGQPEGGQDVPQM